MLAGVGTVVDTPLAVVALDLFVVDADTFGGSLVLVVAEETIGALVLRVGSWPNVASLATNDGGVACFC